jgi:hypothetical protein
MSDTPRIAQPIDKLATLDGPALVTMLARWYLSQAARDGFQLTADNARNAAISAVYGHKPHGDTP